ncbi:UNVERIFIED_ORG: hypothetical protein M2193_008646 [Bradyrhizobium japonicum]|nr:hypothetical protein [Bradyrhizobium sp. CCBAU 45394]
MSTRPSASSRSLTRRPGLHPGIDQRAGKRSLRLAASFKLMRRA